MRDCCRFFFFVVAILMVPCRVSAEMDGALKVSTFSTVLTEVAQKVGGDLVQVSSHVPVGIDPHDFEPRPNVLKIVAGADIVLLSAKHMEGYVGKLHQVVGGSVRFVEVGEKIPSLWIKSDEKQEDRSVKKDGKLEDPHWWHSIENMQKAVRIVRDECVVLRPQHKATFESNATKYLKELATLQQWARARVAELPRDRRRIVTSHDAFQYFAKEFGFTIFSVEGLTPSDQPSSRKVAELLNVIKEQKVRSVFAQDTTNPKVLRQITSETGAVLGGQLWADGLGVGDAATYDGMFRHNVNTIVEGLK